MQERLELLQDLRGIFNVLSSYDKKARYLLVVKPKNMTEDNSIESKIEGVRSFMED